MSDTDDKPDVPRETPEPDEPETEVVYKKATDTLIVRPKHKPTN